MLLSSLVCNICGYTTAQTIGSVDLVTYEVNTNGSIVLQCHTYFRGEPSEIDHYWVFLGNILTNNTDILAINSSRYNVKYQTQGYNRTYTLTIQNPLPTDEGRYRCQIDYEWYKTNYVTDKDVNITTDSYLPLNYPLCSIKPSQTFTNGTITEFEFEVGATTLPITLKLTLRSDNGSVTHLGDFKVTLHDSKAMFICLMTRETFLAAYPNCTVGPLIISENDANQPMQPIKSTSTPPPETKLTTKVSQAASENFITTSPQLLTSEPEPSSRNPHTNQMPTQLRSTKPVSTRLKTKPEQKSTTETSRTTQNLMTTQHFTWTNQLKTSNTKHHVSIKHVRKERLSTLSLITDVSPENTKYMKKFNTEVTGPSNMCIILTSFFGFCQTIITIVIILFMQQYYRKQRPTNETINLVSSSDKGTQTVDSTNMPYQKDFEPEPNTVFNQGDDSCTRTMIPNPEDHHNMHTYEHTIKMHSMAAASNQTEPKVDSTYTPYQQTLNQNLILFVWELPV